MQNWKNDSKYLVRTNIGLELIKSSIIWSRPRWCWKSGSWAGLALFPLWNVSYLAPWVCRSSVSSGKSSQPTVHSTLWDRKFPSPKLWIYWNGRPTPPHHQIAQLLPFFHLKDFATSSSSWPYHETGSWSGGIIAWPLAFFAARRPNSSWAADWPKAAWASVLRLGSV